MNLQDISDNLFRTTESLKAAILNAEAAAEELVSARKALEFAKFDAMKAGKIDGKNEDARKMQYAEFCPSELSDVEFAEKAERRTRDTIELCRLDYDLARYLLRIAELSK